MRGNTLYLAYQNNDSKSWAIKMLIREAGRWSAEPLTISQTEANCYSPGLAFSREDELIVTWYDTREGRTRIFSRRYDILKGSLLDEQRISTRDEAAQSPRVVSSGNKAVVFWESGNRIESKYTDVYVAPPGSFPRRIQTGSGRAIRQPG
jgi:predicted neuraminidase